MESNEEIQLSLESEAGGGGGGSTPEKKLILQRVVQFFETIIGQSCNWLRPVPDACHFAQKLPRKLPENPEFTFEGARVLSLESLVIWLRDSRTGKVVSLFLNLAHWMSEHSLGCFALNKPATQPASV